MDEPDDPSSAMASANIAHSIHECPDDARDTGQVEMMAQSRNPGPGGRKGVRIGLEHVEHDLKHGNDGDGDGDGDDGNRWRMDGATSAARHDAKRVGTEALAGK